jgi:hypothetical protein
VWCSPDLRLQQGEDPGNRGASGSGRALPKTTVPGPSDWRDLDRGFPEARWNDFRVPILRGWAETVVNICHGEYDSAVVYFMDGPYEVRVAQRSEADWVLAFVDGRTSPPKVSGSVRLSAALFVRSVATAVRNVLVACEALRHSSPDVDALVTIAPALEQVARVHGS